MLFLPMHRELCKNAVCVLRPGYTIKGWEICIKFTKPRKYCCKHLKYLSFHTLSGLIFFKEISRRKCWKCRFRASKFQNFPGEDSPRPPTTFRLWRSFSSPPPLPQPPNWKCAPPSLSTWNNGRFKKKNDNLYYQVNRCNVSQAFVRLRHFSRGKYCVCDITLSENTDFWNAFLKRNENTCFPTFMPPPEQCCQ